METIKSITDSNFKIRENDYSTYDGYLIETDKQIIKLGIQYGQSCCENYGYFMSEDNLQEFIGSQLLSINIADEQLKIVDNFDSKEMYEGGTMFVNIYTSIGLLQFVAYNEHNGYYGHNAVVISEQLKYSDTL